MKTIDDFNGNYRFLSNFYPCTVEYEGITYPSNEHYYVAMKTTDLNLRREVANVSTPGQVKRFGRAMEIRPDWDSVKLQVMEYGLRQKFSDPTLAQMLKDTGDAQLVEGNTWGDTYWGICKGVGHNYLGKLLMKVREDTMV
jgi:ribA/ribD-fused uncharacterized protein